ncbi:DNA methyltransferase [Rhodovarius lipocyclicus]|uniref:DNA methyltransferase n=1 Tax=Rhodovarius lipocyclicus TaxID=268410 RepID=UPI0019177C24|nr:DNA methyltransferase [Rhodovarius lipocyclicus]
MSAAVNLSAYQAFLAAKVALAPDAGIPVEASALSPILKPHQRDIVRWAVRKGRAAIFASFGLGKSVMQLEIARVLRDSEGPEARALIVLPLGVRQEFTRDAAMLGTAARFVRRSAEVTGPGIYLTNYESVRDGKLDPALFCTVCLDEAAVLRGFGGTKTFRELMRLFAVTKYRIVATATPSPNEYVELLAYAAFLDVMDVGEAKTRFFKRDSSNADRLTLHPHKEQEFWEWVASWGTFITTPSDLGYPDEGYALPPVEVHWHEVPSDHDAAGEDRDGQVRMFRQAAIGVSDAAAEKRSSLPARIAKMMELRALDPGAHRILWHDLEDERRAIEAAIPAVASAYGSQDLDQREARIIAFSDGEVPELAVKPSIAGTGCNFQRHCAWAIFLGIGFKFHDIIQAFHRIVRFGQGKPVRIDLIYTEAEREVRRSLEAKWARHNELVAQMRAIIRQHGLGGAAAGEGLRRYMAGPAKLVEGQGWRMENDDTVLATARLPENSLGLIVTSIPFATQYEYTPTFNDFGHTDDNDHFWRQMDFLTPSLRRALQPGRDMVIHVKDRITPGGMNGFGFQTLHPFHAEAIDHYRKHGFAFLGMKTITTDVVRENNQTYRLGWSEQCKDGTRMGCGVPEYLLIFRKPPTDGSSGYADVPVVKEKPLCADHGEPAPFDKRRNWKKPVPGTGYSRAAWQLDAHGYSRSSGDRLLSSDELRHMAHEQMFKWWEARNTTQVYDYQEHLLLCERLDELERLPATFMLWPPHSVHDDVWTDVARMRTLNADQVQQGREVHLCPLQFDIVDRVIRQCSMEGEVVYDPFAGIGTVPLRALKLGRQGWGSELSPRYFADAVTYLKAEEDRAAVPSLFAFMDAEDAA